MKILTVQQDPSWGRIYRNLFTQIGYPEVVSANDGTEAMALVREGGIGLILAGPLPPHDSGQQLLQAVRPLPEGARLPFILVAPKTLTADIVETLKQNRPATFVMPPVTAQNLKLAVDQVLPKG